MEHRAVLFDVDGTLVDSNYLHVAAWLRAFASLGRPVDGWRVHRAIGMDSGRLLGELLGPDADRLGDAAKQAHKHAYEATTQLLRPFAQTRELISLLHGREIAVVLATSAPAEEFALLRATLDIDDLIAATTDADDVDTAKPEPDVVRVALERVGVSPEQAIFVGDSVWDMQAATRAGVRAVGVRTGGVSGGELRAAGAADVYDDPTDLINNVAAWLDRDGLDRGGLELGGPELGGPELGGLTSSD